MTLGEWRNLSPLPVMEPVMAPIIYGLWARRVIEMPRWYMLSAAEVFFIVSQSELRTFHSSLVLVRLKSVLVSVFVAMVTNALIVQLDGFTQTTV